MAFEHVRFLSGWFPFEHGAMAMNGTKSTLEIENTGGDFLILEYAYPCREEERGISVAIKIFETPVGDFRGFYSFPFYIGFKIPPFPQPRLPITIEIDQTYFRTDGKGERREYGLILFHLELLHRKRDPDKYRVFEAKVENLKGHLSKLLNPCREAQSLPMALLIEPSSRCNMDCVMCARSIPGHRREDECDLADEFVAILEKSMRGIQASRIQGLGEPLISKNFIPLINLLEQNHVHVVTFNTNGYLLDEEMVQFLVRKGKVFEHFRISFSLDAATKEVYANIRGKDLNRTLKNLRYLQDYKRERGVRHPLALINMTLSKTNIKDLPRFIQLAHDLDVEVELSNLAVDKCYESIQVRRGDHFMFNYKTEVLTAHPRLYNRYLKKAEQLGNELDVTIRKAGEVTYMKEPQAKLVFRFMEILKKRFNPPQTNGLQSETSNRRDPSYENLPLCLLPWSQMVINSHGDISLCCVQGPIDHLRKYRSIEEAWNSENISRIREMLSRKIFPQECQLADCTVKRWNTRVCIVHQ